jgi:2-polyprenyl-6-methoxyphenol hydroxylase-like FAD-dependent oxidoreductase
MSTVTFPQIYSGNKIIFCRKIVDRPSRKALRWCSSKIVLLGDAAHPVTPNLAQGATLAIEDATFFIQMFLQYQNPIDALIEYVRERAPRARVIATESAAQSEMGKWKSPALVVLRDAILRWLPNMVFERRLKKTNVWQPPRTTKA